MVFFAYVHLTSFLALSPGSCLVDGVKQFPLYSSFVKNPLIVFFAVHETRRIFLSPFISKASRRASSFFLRVQLSQLYVATGHASAFISRILAEIGMLLGTCV